jgi:hypothetical protein
MNVEIDNRVQFWHRCYRLVSLTLSIVFGIVGILFLAIPVHVLELFNTISLHFGLPVSPEEGTSFFLILAVAYMYLVSTLAFMMYKNPGNPSLPLLLIGGKSASSIVSILFLVVHGPSLIYAVNTLTDGSIALGVFLLNRKIRKLPL